MTIYSQDLSGALGDGDRLPEADLDALTRELAPALAKLADGRRTGAAPQLAIADATDDFADIEAHARRIEAVADAVVILGTGGSSLGGQTICRLADHGFGPRKGRPRLIFMDNIDPVTFDAMFERLDPARTHVVAMSKSGGTAETMLQALACLRWMDEALGADRAAEAFTALTEPKDSPLKRLAEARRMPTLDHHMGVGGRYAALTNVGLLPAALAGLDIRAIRAGAAWALDASLNVSANESPAAMGAALNIGLQRRRGVGIAVVMPYVDALAPLAFWHRQLWAESLGKGGNGTLPANALGTVDQHSQLQLYLDGPADKFFTLILTEQSGRGAPPADTDDAALRYLAGRPLGDLMDAEQRATVDTLVAAGRPTRVFHLEAVDERAIGALMAHFEMETILAAALLNVDPFDQPAVEDGKVRARNYLESA